MGDDANSRGGRFRYRAFISYSSKDRAIGEKFQRSLEAYKIPTKLRGRETAFGPLPKRVTPIWRDRSDLDAGSLGSLIQRALRDSSALIVLCSPASAASKWVNEEIKTFKGLNRRERIIAVLIDGSPTEHDQIANPTGAFAPALLRKLGSDGSLLEEREPDEPFSPDLREPQPDGSGGDGLGRVIEKVVAALTGVSQGELSQCHEEAERRERAVQRWATIGALTLATIAIIGGVAAYLQRQDALIAESTFLANKAGELDIGTHDHAAAMVVALGALPTGQGLALPRPYVAAAERAFVTAATRNRLAHYLVGHKDQVRAAHYSPDGRLVGTASWDGTSRIWKVDSCRIGICPHLSLIGHTEGVNNIAFSSDSSRVVTASLDKTARVWDANSGASVAVLAGHVDRVTSAVFSPDGSHVATASWDHTVRVWDLTACNSGTCPSIVLNFDRDVDSIAFSSNGQSLSASTDTQTRVWTPAACTSNSCPTIVLEGQKAQFSPDGTRLATINFSFEQGHTARVYTLSACQHERCPFVTLRGHTYFINSVSFSSDGRRVVTAADDKSARVWDLDSCPDAICKPTNVLEGHTDTVRVASFSADGTRVVTASGGFNATTWDARVWDLNAGDCTYGRPCPPIILAGHVGWIYGAEFSRDGTHVVTASSDGTARVWDVTDCRDLACPARTFSTSGADGILAVSTEFQSVVTASGDGPVKVWDTRDCEEKPCEPLTLSSHHPMTFASFSPDGTRLLTLSADVGSERSSRDQNSHTFEAQLWDLAACRNGSCIPCLMIGEMGHAPASTIPSASFSPDGGTVVMISGESAYLGRLNACEKLRCPTVALLGHRDAINGVGYSPDGNLVATASNDTTTRLWRLSSCEARSCEPIQILQDEPVTVQGGNPGPEAQSSVVFAPDGIHLVTTGGRVARVWDLTACGGGGKCQSLILEGHQHEVLSAVFSPDGKRVVTVSEDRTARIWDIDACNEGRCRSLVLEGHLARIGQVLFSSNGKWVLTISSWDGTARLWDVNSGSELMVLGTLREPLRNASFSRDERQVVALGRNKAFAFRTSYPFKEEAGDGRALSERACQFAREIGVLMPTRFQREQALVLSDTVPCDRYGLLSWHFYAQVGELAWSWAKWRASAFLPKTTLNSSTSKTSTP